MAGGAEWKVATKVRATKAGARTSHEGTKGNAETPKADSARMSGGDEKIGSIAADTLKTKPNEAKFREAKPRF